MRKINKLIFCVVLAILIVAIFSVAVDAKSKCAIFENSRYIILFHDHPPLGEHYNLIPKGVTQNKGEPSPGWHIRYNEDSDQWEAWRPGEPIQKYTKTSDGRLQPVGLRQADGVGSTPMEAVKNAGGIKPQPTPYDAIKTVEDAYNEGVFKRSCSPSSKRSVRLGGISTNISAQLLENLTDIKAVVYDPYLEELIFVGEENYSLPKVDLGDLAMALQVPKEDQWVDMDVDIDTSSVTFGDLRLVNSSTGYKLFSADYLLKNMTLDNVSGCMCWKRCVSDETRRIWIYPNESVLKITNNSFVWDKFSVSISQEYLSGRSDNCTNECWNSWAGYLANNFYNLSKDHEEWNKVISTAKIASIANWIKDNNINYSWFLKNYTRNQNTTPSSVPTQHNGWWMCQCNESDCGSCYISLKFTKQGDEYTWAPEQYEYEDCNNYVAGGDDIYINYNLPFSFTFYNNQYSSMYIHSNGHITFDSPDAGWSGFWNKFINHKMIALDARDLITNIYVCNHQNYVTVRLTGGYYGKTTSVDVEVLLYQNGTIKLMLKDVGAYTDHWGNGIITGVSNGTGEYSTATLDLYGGATLDFDKLILQIKVLKH